MTEEPPALSYRQQRQRQRILDAPNNYRRWRRARLIAIGLKHGPHRLARSVALLVIAVSLIPIGVFAGPTVADLAFPGDRFTPGERSGTATVQSCARTGPVSDDYGIGFQYSCAAAVSWSGGERSIARTLGREFTPDDIDVPTAVVDAYVASRGGTPIPSASDYIRRAEVSAHPYAHRYIEYLLSPLIYLSALPLIIVAVFNVLKNYARYSTEKRKKAKPGGPEAVEETEYRRLLAEEESDAEKIDVVVARRGLIGTISFFIVIFFAGQAIITACSPQNSGTPHEVSRPFVGPFSATVTKCYRELDIFYPIFTPRRDWTCVLDVRGVPYPRNDGDRQFLAANSQFTPEDEGTDVEVLAVAHSGRRGNTGPDTTLRYRTVFVVSLEDRGRPIAPRVLVWLLMIAPVGMVTAKVVVAYVSERRFRRPLRR